jgi:ankyrin repeat protein
MRVVLKNIHYYEVFNFNEIDGGIVPRGSFWRKGSSDFFRLVLYEEVEKVANILVNDRFQVYQYDMSFHTPLFVAVHTRNLSMVKLLIKFGSDVNWRDMAGRSALFYAV